MTPNALLSSFDLSDGSVAATAPRLARETAERLQAPRVRSKIAALSRLPDTACNTLMLRNPRYGPYGGEGQKTDIRIE